MGNWAQIPLGKSGTQMRGNKHLRTLPHWRDKETGVILHQLLFVLGWGCSWETVFLALLAYLTHSEKKHFSPQIPAMSEQRVRVSEMFADLNHLNSHSQHRTQNQQAHLQGAELAPWSWYKPCWARILVLKRQDLRFLSPGKDGGVGRNILLLRTT